MSYIMLTDTGTYPFSNDISGLYPKYINIFRATLLISIFCVVSTPWNIIRNASGLLAFLSGYSCLMGPMAGIMVCDYYIIKKQKLDIHELYKDHGIYWYSHGWNWRAFLAFLIAFAPLLPGFAKSIQPTLEIGGAWKVSHVKIVTQDFFTDESFRFTPLLGYTVLSWPSYLTT